MSWVDLVSFSSLLAAVLLQLLQTIIGMTWMAFWGDGGGREGCAAILGLFVVVSLFSRLQARDKPQSKVADWHRQSNHSLMMTN